MDLLQEYGWVGFVALFALAVLGFFIRQWFARNERRSQENERSIDTVRQIGEQKRSEIWVELDEHKKEAEDRYVRRHELERHESWIRYIIQVLIGGDPPE